MNIDKMFEQFLSAFTQSTVLATIIGNVTLPANPDRIGLLLFSAPAGIVTYRPGETVVANSGGIILGVGDKPFLLHPFFYGDLVTKSVLVTDTVAENVNFVEIFPFSTYKYKKFLERTRLPWEQQS